MKLALFIAAAISLAGPKAAAEVKALLIGIGDYPSSTGFARLDGPPNDLRIMREWLAKGMGVREQAIQLLADRDATNAGIQRAIQRYLIESCGPGDVALLYFSGHGTQVEDLGPEQDEVDGLDEALVTADYDPVETSTWLTDDILNRQLAAVKAGHVLVMFDCCHSGTATRGIKGAGSAFRWNTRSVTLPDTGVRGNLSPAHHLYLAACDDGELARQVYDERIQGPAGVFTSAFASIASGSGLDQPLGAFQSALRDEVGKAARKLGEHFQQKPVFQAPRMDFSLKSFLGGQVFAQTVPPAPAPGVLDGFTQTGSITVNLETGKSHYRWTDELTATVRVDRQAHVRVFHVDPDGAFTQIHPNAVVRETLLRPGETLDLPPRAAVKGRIYPLRVTGPKQGLEALVAVASSKPFTDAEAREFAAGGFNSIPASGFPLLLSRGIEVVGRAETSPGAGGPVADRQTFGQDVRVFKTSQY